MIDIDGYHLNIEDIVKVARHYENIVISESGKQNIQKAHAILEKILKSKKPVYGINTGYGVFSDQRIPRKHSDQLSRNLILSHSVGTGPPLPDEVVRAAMVVRANTLAKGYSGVRLKVVQSLVDMLNAGVTPQVPEQGSLGSSGDLGPLSHLALVFTTDEKDRLEESGWANYQGKCLPGKEAMAAAGLGRITLGPKEGLAINNGATFCAAVAALATYDGRRMIEIADLAISMSLEALMGCNAAFDPRLHEARGQTGQIQSAKIIRENIAGSNLLGGAKHIQDAYSLRCAPPVHGAVRDTLDYSWQVVSKEINAATDNPLLFPDGGALSGGNFHGEPVGFAMDFLGIALAELGAISERRIYRMLDGNLNAGLPPMLVDNHDEAGLNSGLMMLHYTAAALVLENQALAHPNSVHSLPTSAGQEDHNANAMTAARNTRKIAENTVQILSIELYTAARALDYRLRHNSKAKLGKQTMKAYQIIRSEVPYQPGDHLWGPEVNRVRELVTKGHLL